MIRKTKSKLSFFKRSETGNATIEFVMIVPFFLAFLGIGAEMNVITTQHGALEQGVDRVVRDIRLNTGTKWDHDVIKIRICEISGIQNCEANLRLEMIRQNAFVGINLPEKPDCTDSTEEVNPLHEFKFDSGESNELMILRACLRVDPVFKTSVIAREVPDESGHYSLTATTAFVQEPR
ncbi:MULTISPECIES: TadE/TadG family type IV pilus assembly protein [unclassified Ruegeria]|uniref:TadE/TadG family type IV pilus assembly protein n=1 Tax=unclassified Ruegeria TaxID=2625375 RepID=UPI0014890AA9|nr:MULTISPECIES: pilus assembly protein [unclassified Ruegeria]NOD74977.1 pilus assembly protein [Ruegeria sp. HKCCD4332]NOD86938.1 pilus assembly protein [Ruegeria sp. HKCCD4318]NOD93538.1 pilus assembly protein [Ruegeria sp. HKCCD4884]NOE12493.1 pilus assembly protein [Ruegeria sp. HKCCD4318-2]NOG09342.1 pilus assembly protein [Ruegeria sp. HKCCD4315]